KPVLNGIFGDYLAETENGLAIKPGFYKNNQKIHETNLIYETSYTTLSSRVSVFLHGLVCDENYWDFQQDEKKTSYGQMLEQDLQFTPFYFRYNSGLRISENGKLFSEFMENLVQNYPIPIDELVIVAHSMGGLVSRSAFYYAEQGKASWLQVLKKIILIGSPHLGAPLEKFGNILTNVLEAVPSTYTRLAGNLINLRSKGIKDLRFGNIIDEDWKDVEEDALLQNAKVDIPLYTGVKYYVISGTITKDPEHIFSHWFGDAMVRRGSALGRTKDGKDFLLIEDKNHKEFTSIGHIGLGHSLEVYEQIREWVKEGLSEAFQEIQKEEESEAEKNLRLEPEALQGLSGLVETAIAGGAKTIEEIQNKIMDKPYGILKKVIPIPGLISGIEKMNRKSLGGVYQSIQVLNKEINRLAQDYLEKKKK
ncbi:MAG: alpha/beta hydrolase, partial [Leptospiraceae bacterium]|nr:alpha/beta hydrolase [Leptospiraceae bacterium]